MCEKNKVIEQKDEKIDSLQRTLDAIMNETRKTKEAAERSERASEQSRQIAEEIKEELGEVQDELESVKTEAIETNHRLETVQDKLQIAKEDRVPKLSIKSKRESFAVIRVHPSNDSEYDYYAIRGQKTYVDIKQRSFIRDHKDSYLLTTIEYQPNPRNLYWRLKKTLKDRINYSANWFSVKDCSDSSLIDEINSIDADKYSV